MKICILGDTHFGMRSDSINFLNFVEKFYADIFFPYLIKNNIKTIIQLGDFFDRRKYINFYTLKRTKEIFFDKLIQYNINMIVLAGNHDVFFRNTNEINSISLLMEQYKNIKVIDSPQTITLNHHNKTYDICAIPWICHDNYEKCIYEMDNTSAKICCGHFEISGFEMHRGHVTEDGLNRNIFKNFEYIFSGHYHHRSNQNNIFYVGTPTEMTWEDFNDDRGFHIFDLSNNNLEFIKNPNLMFYRIEYDDTTDVSFDNLEMYKGKYVKVVVINKTKPHTFDTFLSLLYDVNPIDVSIVEDFVDLTENVSDEEIENAEDTITVINKVVDSIESENIDVIKLKKIMREIYVEALNKEI